MPDTIPVDDNNQPIAPAVVESDAAVESVAEADVQISETTSDTPVRDTPSPYKRGKNPAPERPGRLIFDKASTASAKSGRQSAVSQTSAKHTARDKPDASVKPNKLKQKPPVLKEKSEQAQSAKLKPDAVDKSNINVSEELVLKEKSDTAVESVAVENTSAAADAVSGADDSPYVYVAHSQRLRDSRNGGRVGASL